MKLGKKKIQIFNILTVFCTSFLLCSNSYQYLISEKIKSLKGLKQLSIHYKTSPPCVKYSSVVSDGSYSIYNFSLFSLSRRAHDADRMEHRVHTKFPKLKGLITCPAASVSSAVVPEFNRNVFSPCEASQYGVKRLYPPLYKLAIVPTPYVVVGPTEW